MNEHNPFLADHLKLTRRYFLRAGAACAAAAGGWAFAAGAEPPAPELAKALDKLEPFFTAQEEFQRRLPRQARAALPARRQEARSRPRHARPGNSKSSPTPTTRPTLGEQLTRADGTALDFPALMRLAEKHAVRFAKVMTCLNIGCPLGMGVWEGVPLRDVVWLTRPQENLRRVFYYGYHNDDPKQLFRSSLPVGRVLEDYGRPAARHPLLQAERGVAGSQARRPGAGRRAGGLRVQVGQVAHPRRADNLDHANDTYAGGNNDIDSPLKTFAATLFVPTEVKSGEPMPVTGYAQVGVSGLSKVQVWMQPAGEAWPADDPYFAKAPWSDAQILGPPKHWGGGLADGAVPKDTMGFDATTGRPRTWPMRLAKVHWAALLPGLPAGEYTLRCRTLDEKGVAQPMPRPFRKSGHSAIEEVKITVKA